MQSRGPQHDGKFGARQVRSRKVSIVAICLLTTLAMATAPASRGQHAEKCNESTVRQKSTVPVTQSAANDIYANTTTSKGPLRGKAPLEALRAANMAERKNSKPAVFSPDKIVTSKTGDMAYDYGTARVGYDLASSGQHIAYDVEYLRVWKVNGGVCQVEGIFSRPDKFSGINK